MPTPSETAAIKADAMRDFATKHEHINDVLWVDLDRGRPVRVSTLARDEAARYDEEARRG